MVKREKDKVENKVSSNIDCVDVCVIGIGFVGLNLINIFKSNKNFKVRGYDTSSERILELDGKNKDDNVIYQSTITDLENCDLFIVCVPTNVHFIKRDLDLENIINVKLLLERVAKQGSTIVVESSMYIGGTRELFGNFSNKNIHVGFSPERIESGRKIPTLNQIPKIISGINNTSLDKIRQYYSSVFDACISVSSLETAEMCKLYENCFRIVNIAYTNQIADMCDELNIDKNEMISACETKPYGFMKFNHGLGIGGYCLPYNPYYLMKYKEIPILKESCSFLELRPYVKACEFLEKYKSNRILIIGLGFKTGQGLITNSPSVCFAYSLIKCNRIVRCYDPLVQRTDLPQFANFIDFIHLDNYNEAYINENFDTVIITMTQNDIDYSVLGKLDSKINVISFI